MAAKRDKRWDEMNNKRKMIKEEKQNKIILTYNKKVVMADETRKIM